MLNKMAKSESTAERKHKSQKQTLESEKNCENERLLFTRGTYIRKLLQKIFHLVMCVGKHCAKILR